VSARHRRTAFTAAVAVAALSWPAAAAAQLASPSAAALAAGENVTATARGFSATAWNPAGLGMPGTGRFSLTLFPARGVAGLDPIGLDDLSAQAGEILTDQVKRDWLARIQASGRQQGSAGADLTILALNAGRLGVQVSSSMRGVMDLAPDAAEVVLFGNVGESGQLRDYQLAGSAIDMAAYSTIAVAWGQPFRVSLGPLPAQNFAAGVTVKYTVGHVLIAGRDAGSVLQGDPLGFRLDFPVIHTPFQDVYVCEPGVEECTESNAIRTIAYDGMAGSGIGVDVGAAWQAGPFSAGVVIRNLVNGFAWDADRMVFTAARADVEAGADSVTAEFEVRPFSEAPASLRNRLDDLGFAPTLAVGGAFRALPILTLTADLRRELGEALRVGARTHLGAGAELRALPILPVRVGLAAISGGYQISGGLGLELGLLTLNAAAAHRSSDVGTDSHLMATVGFGAR
jgi:hypothetical protein